MTYDAEVVLNVIKARASCRNYQADLPEKELQYILQAGDAAPSGGNTKQTKIMVFTGREQIEKLEKIAEREFSQMTVADDMYKSLKSSVMLSKAGGYHFAYQAPVLILCANKKDYPNNMADCAVIVENMMIAASAFGLGSCYVNQIHWLTDKENIRSFLEPYGLKEDENVYAGLVIGYPEFQQKKRNYKRNEIIWAH